MVNRIKLKLFLLFTISVFFFQNCGQSLRAQKYVESTVISSVGESNLSESEKEELKEEPITFISPKESITSKELGVIVNQSDPQSMAVGKAYQEARNIPNENIIFVDFKSDSTTIDYDKFQILKQEIDRLTPENIQAYAITWTHPSGVRHPSFTDPNNSSKSYSAIQSITSAIGYGADKKYINYHGYYGCASTASVAYYNSASVSPKEDFGSRPAMMLAGWTLEEALKLIQRGLEAEASFPTASGYFIRTTDRPRSVRYFDFSTLSNRWQDAGLIDIHYIDSSTNSSTNALEDVSDVFYYLTGLTSIPKLDTLNFAPGAVGDHLTSYGGQIKAPGSSGQMSILRWLEAGATGSFGTVQEPCNYQGKFPRASILLHHYFSGNTLIEAYSKSVLMPGEGLFVGDPLAKPFGTKLINTEGFLTLKTTALKPGVSYILQGKDTVDEEYIDILNIKVDRYQYQEIDIGEALYKNYRLKEM